MYPLGMLPFAPSDTGMKAENSGIVGMRLAQTKGKKFEVGLNTGSPKYRVDTMLCTLGMLMVR